MKYELINYCENDKYAKKAYSLIHNEPESKNLGDITLVNEKEIADFNWMVGGSPCQDFSVAGKGKGAVWTCKNCKDDEGNDYQYNPLEVHYTKRDKCPKCNSTNIEKTRSSLVVEWLRILHAKKPNIAIYENVKNLVGKKHKHFFDLFINELQEYGYNTYYKVLNAKDYGIPQNRERIYVVAINTKLDNGQFSFPQTIKLEVKLKDLLEKTIDEKFYINKPYKLLNKEDESNSSVCRQIAKVDLKGHDYLTRVYDVNFSSPTLPTGTGGNHEPKVLELGYFPYPNSDKKHQSNTFYSTEGLCQTLDTCQGGNRQMKVLANGRIRKLTPLEYFRLMGFEDNDFYIAQKGLNETFYKGKDRSSSQLYKMAGNSIVVDVLYYIYLELYKAMPYLFEDIKLGSFFSGIGAFEKAIVRLQETIHNQINKGI